MSHPVSRRTMLQQASATLLALGGVTPAAAAQAAATTVFYNAATLRHQPGSSHPERPTRLEAVMDAVRALQRQGRLSMETARPAVDDDVLLVHTSQYLRLVRGEVAAGRRSLSTGDTEISPGTFDAALAAAGTVVSAVDAVFKGGIRHAFCAVRPPGHHASQERGMGF